MRQFLEDLTPRLNEIQIKQLGVLCFDTLSSDIKNDLVGQHLSTVNISQLSKILNLIKGEEKGESLSNIIPNLSRSLQLSDPGTVLTENESIATGLLHNGETNVETNENMCKQATSE